MFFVRDSREYVKNFKKDVPKRDIMLEVGKLWSLVKAHLPCAGVSSLDFYQELARQDLERFKREHAQYVSLINSLRHQNVKKSEKHSVRTIDPNGPPDNAENICSNVKRTTLSDYKGSSFRFYGSDQ